MKKIKICLVNGMMDSSKIGGAPISVINLSKNFSKKGHNVTVVSSDKVDIPGVKNLQSSELIHINFSRLTAFNIKEILRNWQQAYYLLKYYLNTSSIIKKKEYDIVDNQGFWTNKQDVITVRYCIEGYYQKVSSLVIISKLKRFLLSLIDLRIGLLRLIESHYYRNKRYKKIIAVSEKIKEELIRYHAVKPENIIVIHNGFEKERFFSSKYKKVRTKIRKTYHIKSSEVVITLVGKNLARKNIGLFIAILENLESQNFKVFIIGSKEQLAVSDRIRLKIINIPWVSNIEEFYFASDIFLFPTLYDACAKVVLEAMAAKNCVLTTYESGCSSFIRNRKNGFVFDHSSSSKDYENVINYLMKNRSKLEEIRNQACRAVSKNSWESVAKKWLKAYSEINKKN